MQLFLWNAGIKAKCVSQINKIYEILFILNLDFLCKIEKNDIQILNMENQKGWH